VGLGCHLARLLSLGQHKPARALGRSSFSSLARCVCPPFAAAVGVPEGYAQIRTRRRSARPRQLVVVNGYEGSQRPCNHSIHPPYFQEVSTWSGKYRCLRGLNFSSWQVCPARLESLHDRSEESSSRSAREARGSKGGKVQGAKMIPEGRSKSAGKAAKARWAKRRREESP
jgi:hypothetical protein